jgi:hypothetical protein
MEYSSLVEKKKKFIFQKVKKKKCLKKKYSKKKLDSWNIVDKSNILHLKPLKLKMEYSKKKWNICNKLYNLQLNTKN